MELIQMGKQDVIFAGGGEELHWSTSVLFDAMGAMSSKYNETPQSASRTYDANRDGFVISGGGGVLALEALDHALDRGAPILAELVGYGASSDGFDMVQPSGEGAIRCMHQAIIERMIIDLVDIVNDRSAHDCCPADIWQRARSCKTDADYCRLRVLLTIVLTT